MATSVSIKISSGVPNATFGANPLMFAGDNASWRNNDGKPHWPFPAGQPTNTWLSFQIAAHVAGRPAPTSNDVSFDLPGDYPYKCAIPGHDAEHGTVHVATGNRP